MKVSEMLVEYAGSYIDSATTPAERQNLLNVACTAWNIAVLPRHERKRAVSRYLDDFRRHNPQETGTRYLRRDIENLVKHKIRLFPDARRPIVGAEIVPNGDTFSIKTYSMRVEHE